MAERSYEDQLKGKLKSLKKVELLIKLFASKALKLEEWMEQKAVWVQVIRRRRHTTTPLHHYTSTSTPIPSLQVSDEFLTYSKSHAAGVMREGASPRKPRPASALGDRGAAGRRNSLTSPGMTAEGGAPRASRTSEATTTDSPADPADVALTPAGDGGDGEGMERRPSMSKKKSTGLGGMFSKMIEGITTPRRSSVSDRAARTAPLAAPRSPAPLTRPAPSLITLERRSRAHAAPPAARARPPSRHLPCSPVPHLCHRPPPPPPTSRRRRPRADRLSWRARRRCPRAR